jgi:hypothetical protein
MAAAGGGAVFTFMLQGAPLHHEPPCAHLVGYRGPDYHWLCVPHSGGGASVGEQG